MGRVTPAELSTAVLEAVRAAVEAGDLAVPVPDTAVVERPKQPRARRLRHQRRAAAGQAGRPAAARGRRAARRRGCGSIPGVDRVDVAGPGFLNITLAKDALGGLVAHRARRRARRTGGATRWPASGSTWSSSRPTRPARCTSRTAGGPPSATRSAGCSPRPGAEVTPGVLLQRRRRPDRPVRRLAAGRRARPADAGGRLPRRVRRPRSPRTVVAGRTPGCSSRPTRRRSTSSGAEGVELMFAEIRRSLADFGVEFDVYFSERTLHETGEIELAVSRLREQGHVYDADGAVWLRTTDFGDDKDRVLVRSDGRPTYFDADCAYYLDKRERGSDRCSTCSAPTTTATSAGCGRSRPASATTRTGPSRSSSVSWSTSRGGRMSRRAGNLVLLDEVLALIGSDAARYALVRWSMDSPIDIDVDLWASQTADNPVFYVQYAHARLASLARNAAELGIALPDPSEVDYGLLGHEREGDLLRALGEFPRVVASAAELRAPHRVARYLEELAGTYHRFYDACRVLPQGDEQVDPLTYARLALCEATRVVLGNGSACSASPRRSGCEPPRMRTHEAGALHADVSEPPRACWLRRRTAPRWRRRSGRDGGAWRGRRARHRRRRRPRPRGRRTAPRRTCWTRRTSASRCRDSSAFGRRSPDADVHYAGKAFCCWPVLRWVDRGGPRPRRLHRRRAGRRAARRVPAGADRRCTATTSRSPSWSGRWTPASAGSCVDSFAEIARLAGLAEQRGVPAAGAGPGHGRRRGAHPRVHRDRARGPEVRLLAGGRRRRRGGPPGGRACRRWSWSGCTRTSARRSSTPSGFEVAAHRVVGLLVRLRDELGVEPPCLDLGGGLGIAYTGRRRPGGRAGAGGGAARDRRPGSAPRPGWRCRGWRSSRAGRSPGRPPSRSTRSARSRTPRTGAYVSVDGGMSDNIRTALYDADYTCVLASRVSEAPPVLCRVVGKHCESGDIVVRDSWLPADLAPGDLVAVAATGAYCRSMASNYNHVPRPPVVAVRDGAARGRGAPGDRGRPAPPGRAGGGLVKASRVPVWLWLVLALLALLLVGEGRLGGPRRCWSGSRWCTWSSSCCAGGGSEGRAARLRDGRHRGRPAARRAGRRPGRPGRRAAGAGRRRGPPAGPAPGRAGATCSPPTPPGWSSGRTSTSSSR